MTTTRPCPSSASGHGSAKACRSKRSACSPQRSSSTGASLRPALLRPHLVRSESHLGQDALELEDLLPEELRHDGIRLDPTKVTVDISGCGYTVDDLQERVARGQVLLTLLDHGAGLFELLDASRQGITLTDLARSTGISTRSTSTSDAYWASV